MDFNKIIARVKNILLTPKSEWPIIGAESTTLGSLYGGYIVVLAAVAAIAMFIGTLTAGFGFFGLGTSFALRLAVVNFVLSLVFVYLFALLVNVLAPTFGGQKDLTQAFKVTAYSFTAGWVGTIGYIVPIVGTLLMLAGVVYGIYLLFVGLPHTMKCPPDKAAAYTAVSIVGAIVGGVILNLVLTPLLGFGMFGGMSAGNVFGNRDSIGGADPTEQRLEDWAEKLEEASAKLESAQQAGNPQATAAAAGALLGAAVGADSTAAALEPERLRGFVPDTLANLPRRSIAVQRSSPLGFMTSQANAEYGSEDGSARIQLEIFDAAGAAGIMAMAGWAGTESESEGNGRRERVYSEGGRSIREEWDSNSNSGRYEVLLGQRFIASVDGSGVTAEQLKAALAQIDLAQLERLKDVGRKGH